MTVYRKCRPCKHRDDCAIKTRLAAAIKGFGVGSISHACRAFEPDFRTGENVWVRVQDQPHADEGYPLKAVFPAHFVAYSKTLGRAIIFIEPGIKSRCGEYGFTPANGKNGFCKVSYAPYRARQRYSIDKGIIERREGFTATQSCCGRPIGAKCDECSNFAATTELAEIW